MADRVGQQLGNYRLNRLLGKGGFAEVYLGEHIYLKTPAAIKLLQTKVANEQDLQAFLKEAQTIAQLVHPHIVRVLDFGVDGETPFLVMDYATGGTLRQRHPRGSQLPLTTILSYVKQLAQALQYAHEEKFIHRDVKPENMLVGRRDAVLLSDFGIALIAQSSRYQSTQEVIGTVAYMSPEQIQGKPRPQSDQYSLGVVVYEWLCGDRPFHGSFTELCAQHMFAPPPPLYEKLPTLSPAVEQVVMTALAKDPKGRFASIQSFATALEQASQVEESQTLPASRSLPPTDAMTQLRPSQPPAELATSPSESVIPTELITPPGSLSIPYEHEHGRVGADLYGNKSGLRVVQISTVVMFLVATIQFIIAGIGGSAGLFADALHNLGGMLTTVELWIAFSISNRATNSRYTYGYSRAEDLAGIFIVLVIIASAVAGAVESIQKLTSRNAPTQLFLSMAAALVGVAGNEILAQYKISVGKRINSVPLIADGQHSRIDGLTSLAAFIGLIGVALGFPIADPIAGLVITVVILTVVYSTTRSVLQRLPSFHRR